MCWYTNRIKGSCDESAIAYNLTLFYSFKNRLCHLIQRLWNSILYQYDNPDNKLKDLFIHVVSRFQQLFSHITTVSSCDRKQCSLFSTASLKYRSPDTWYDTTSSHVILILRRPVLALPHKSEYQASTILITLVYYGPGSNPWPPIPRSRHSTNWPSDAGETGRRLSSWALLHLTSWKLEVITWLPLGAKANVECRADMPANATVDMF